MNGPPVFCNACSATRVVQGISISVNYGSNFGSEYLVDSLFPLFVWRVGAHEFSRVQSRYGKSSRHGAPDPNLA